MNEFISTTTLAISDNSILNEIICMKKYSVAWLIISVSFLLLFQFSSYSQNIGIGTTNPKARLHVMDSSVVFSGNQILPIDPGNPPITGPGRRMMWYADRAAFRVGLLPPITGTKAVLAIILLQQGTTFQHQALLL
jgi:hypothetical protein